MPFDDAKWSALVSQWEEDQDDVEDVDTPPVPAEDPMVLPEMDLSGDVESAETVADNEAAEGEPESFHASTETAIAPMRMPSRASTPKADPASLDWKQLGDRLAAAELGRGQSRAYESMFANVGAQSGYRPNAHAGEAALNVAKQPLELAREKQGMESRDLAMQGQRNAMGIRQAMDDPNSLQSQKAREAVKSQVGDAKLPSGFEEWTANDIQRFVSGGALNRMSADRARKDAAAAKAQAGAAKAEAAEGDLINSRKAFANELKDLGIDPTHASQKDIDRAISLRHAKATEKMAGSNLAIAQSNRRDKDDDKAALRETIPFAGGELKYTGGGTPREDDRKKAQDVAASWNAALSGMDVLEKSLQSYATHPSAETKRDVDSKVRVVSSALNSAVGGGAMSQDEAVAMSQALGADLLSPTGVEAFIRSVAGDDPGAAKALTTRLKSVRESAKASATGKLKSYRYEMGGEGATGGKVRVRNKQTGQTGTITAPFDEAKYERIDG